VVDDDWRLRDALVEVLREAGHDAHGVEEGSAALEHCRLRGPPSVILLDLMMPGMDGWTTLRHLRQDPDLAAARVIVMTAGGPDAVLSARGAHAYLRKPVCADTLLEQVDECVAAQDSGGYLGSGYRLRSG
jgi:CheY-like chemotaxis protein